MSQCNTELEHLPALILGPPKHLGNYPHTPTPASLPSSPQSLYPLASKMRKSKLDRKGDLDLVVFKDFQCRILPTGATVSQQPTLVLETISSSRLDSKKGGEKEKKNRIVRKDIIAELSTFM